ncbi:MAG: trypsin-like peptidase domain-containing protein [Prevotella sp.]|nr:trypsin-like peptidase domain-containing protein [Prevotella sp.]
MKVLNMVVTLLFLSLAHSTWGSEAAVINYIKRCKMMNLKLHPVEGIWQSSDGFKYGIIYKAKIGAANKYSIEIISSPYYALQGRNRGYIYDDNTSIFYPKGYIMEYTFMATDGDKTYDVKQKLSLYHDSPYTMSFQSRGGLVSLNKIYPKDGMESTDGNYPRTNPPVPINPFASVSSGTGFFISGEGLIATNYHVIEGARDIKVTKVNGDDSKKYSAKVEVSDKQNDLAIIKITDPSFSTIGGLPYSFKFTTSSVGEDCFVLGYPLVNTMGTEIKLTTGVISSRTGFNGNVSEYQISAPVQPGNSGAPLFDKNGNVIGVVCAKHAQAENAGYAIKASYLSNLIDLLPRSIILPHVNKLIGKTLPQQVEIANKAVCLIVVEGDD